MKKTILILATVIIGCSQPNDLPIPIEAASTTTSIAINFEGNWNCNDWVVDEIIGTTHRREIIFSGETSSSVEMSLNDYNSSGSMNQLITLSHCNIDSTFFDNQTNPQGTSYKGVLTTDSTLLVYQYTTDAFNVLDTVQYKEFLKQ